MVLSLLLPTQASRLLPLSTQGCNRVRLMGDGKEGCPCSVVALHCQWGPRHGYEGILWYLRVGQGTGCPHPRMTVPRYVCSVSNSVVAFCWPWSSTGHVLVQRLQSFGVAHLSWVGAAGLPWPLPIPNFDFLLGPTNYVPSYLSISFCIKWFPYNSAFNYTGSLRLLQEIINIIILLHTWMLDPDSFEVISKE